MNTEIESALQQNFPKDVSNKILEYGTAMTFRDQMRDLVKKKQTEKENQQNIIKKELKDKFKKYFEKKFKTLHNVAEKGETSATIYHLSEDKGLFYQIPCYFSSIKLYSLVSIKMYYPTIGKKDVLNLAKEVVEEINQSYQLSIVYSWEDTGRLYRSYTPEIKVSW